MYHILRYSRLKSIKVERISDNLLKSICYLKDSIQEIEVNITVQLPELEIVNVDAWVMDDKKINIPKEEFKGILNTRIGPGIFKIINATVKTAYEQIPFMLEECCRGIILSFTKEDLLKSSRPEDDEEAIKYYANMLKENRRLYDRCAAFAPGSRIVERYEEKKC